MDDIRFVNYERHAFAGGLMISKVVPNTDTITLYNAGDSSYVVVQSSDKNTKENVQRIPHRPAPPVPVSPTTGQNSSAFFERTLSIVERKSSSSAFSANHSFVPSSLQSSATHISTSWLP